MGQGAVYTILVTDSTSDTAYDVVVSDQIHSALEVAGVRSTEHTISVDGQLVTVAMEQLLPGETATITIEVVPLRSALVSNLSTVTTPGGENTATAELDVVPPQAEEELAPEAGSVILLGIGLLTLTGYAGARYGKR